MAVSDDMTRPSAPRADQLARLLERQQHVVAREQALACGLSQGAIRHRLRPGGPWRALAPGVYLAVTGDVTADQRDIAALLHAGPRSALTGAAALRRHGLPAPASEMIDVLVPVTVRRGSTGFARVHRTSRMPELICVDGALRYTLVPRAVADAARGLTGLKEVRAVVAGAVQRRRCPLPLLAEELRAGPAQGSALLAAALAEVADGIRSVAEADLRDLIVRSRLPMPMFNARLLDGTTFLAMVDAWWPGPGVAVEIDSREWHLSPEQWEVTSARHALLSARGVIVLHFTPRQVKYEAGEVVATIRLALANAPARLSRPIRALPATD